MLIKITDPKLNDPFENIPRDVIFVLLLYLNNPRYYGYFLQLNKQMLARLKVNNSIFQSYWKTLYQQHFPGCDLVKIASNQNSASTNSDELVAIENYFVIYQKAFLQRNKQDFKRLCKKQKLLFNTIRYGDLKYLESNLNIRWAPVRDFLCFALNTTPILFASVHKRQDFLTFFYRKAIEVISLSNTKRDIEGNTQLHWAAACNILSAIIPMNTKGIINLKNQNDKTPLYIAIENGHTLAVKALIQEKANVNLISQKSTPLYLAAQNGHIDIVTALIEAGANVNRVNQDGFFPLLIATQNGHIDVAKTLIKAGANVNQTLRLGASPLFVAIGSCIDLVTTLIAAGADVNLVKPHGLTPLHLAIYKGQLNTVRSLIRAGANVNFEMHISSTSLTPLHLAAQDGHVEIANVLIRAGADINQTTLDGETPLFIATKNAHLELIKTLLVAGANLNQNHTDTKTPLSIANPKQHSQIYALLKLWELKNASTEKPLLNLIIDILEARIDIEKNEGDTFFANSKNKQVKELIFSLNENLEKYSDIMTLRHLIKSNEAIIPNEKYFLLDHVLHSNIINGKKSSIFFRH